VGTDILGIVPGSDCRFLSKLRRLFRGLNSSVADGSVRRRSFPCLCDNWAISRSAIAVGYVMHGLWDISHCLSGSSLAGLSMTETPLGYGIFCSTYDFVVACYLMISDTAWHKPGNFDPS
jgi:hypothetical protein